jgi:hypothetical protein
MCAGQHHKLTLSTPKAFWPWVKRCHTGLHIYITNNCCSTSTCKFIFFIWFHTFSRTSTIHRIQKHMHVCATVMEHDRNLPALQEILHFISHLNNFFNVIWDLILVPVYHLKVSGQFCLWFVIHTCHIPHSQHQHNRYYVLALYDTMAS